MSKKVAPAKRSLGQNFLTNKRVCEKIVRTTGITSENVVIEIGPGKGALTSLLADQSKKVIAIEKDRALAKTLFEELPQKNIEIIPADILHYDIPPSRQPWIVVGNIPYNISTPIIEKIIQNRDRIKAFYLTVQLEFAKRLAASPGNKDYGSLSCFVQYYAKGKIYFRIKNTNFYPVPKVHSAFIGFQFKETPKENPDLLFKIIRTAFQYRRKKLLNSLSFLIDKDKLYQTWKELQWNENCRAEEKSLEDFMELEKRVRKLL